METVKEREQDADKRRAGRPQKTIKRNKFLMVRLTTAEYLMIKSRAEHAGLKPSQWFRKAARSAKVTPRFSQEEMKLLRSLTGQANNLNQLTKMAHAQGLISLTATLRNHLEQTDLLITKLSEDDG